jgi:hypothetical protein
MWVYIFFFKNNMAKLSTTKELTMGNIEHGIMGGPCHFGIVPRHSMRTWSCGYLKKAGNDEISGIEISGIVPFP